MIQTLAGTNTLGLRAELRKLVAAFVAEQGDLALERVEGDEVEFDRILEACTSLPFLANKKLVVLRSPGANKQFVERAPEILKELPDTTDLLIVEPKLDKRSSYYKFLKANTDYKEFTELDANGLAAWLQRTAKDKNGKISSNDARYLIDRVGASQQVLSQELEKLLIHNAEITRADIDLLTDAVPQSTIFELLEAAFAGRQRRAFELYREQRALKVEPQQIIAMLGWQLHVLALVKTAGERPMDIVAKEAKMSPYVLGKSQSVARNLSANKLKSLIGDLLLIDTRSKRTALDLDEALQLYLLQLFT